MIKQNLQNVKSDLNEILLKLGKPADAVKLLAVTKTQTIEIINTAITAGGVYIAENKVQDASLKIPHLAVQPTEFHFIGKLQSNKINKLLALKPNLIHTIDKLSTAEKLNNALQKNGRIQEVLIQVNTSDEEQKNGVAPQDLLELVRSIAILPNLKIKGLMTVSILSDDESKIRFCFAKLRKLFKAIEEEKIKNVDMKYLSMGMSGDYKIAIEEGANIIRLGSIIFGKRVYK